MRSLRASLLLTGAAMPLLPAGPAPPDDLVALEHEIARRVNEHRLGLGLEPLVYDSAIAAIARAHRVDMAVGRVPMGHDGFAGRADRVKRVRLFTRIAENVALNDYGRDRTAAVAMEGWLESPHHRENIEGAFDVTGVGAARSSDGTIYFTQLFVARRR